MVTVSSSILSPRDDTGGAFSHAPDSLVETQMDSYNTSFMVHVHNPYICIYIHNIQYLI